MVDAAPATSTGAAIAARIAAGAPLTVQRDTLLGPRRQPLRSSARASLGRETSASRSASARRMPPRIPDQFQVGYIGPSGMLHGVDLGPKAMARPAPA